MSSEHKKNNTKQENLSLPKAYEITAQGSLGILALGAAGIKAWRKKREEERMHAKTKSENE